MLHLYGIVEPHAPYSGKGLDGEPLIRIACGRVDAIASELGEPFDPTPAQEALWEHERVLEALLQSGPVLPVRFGVRFPDHDALSAEVQSRSTELAKALAHVRGRVEVGIRLLALEEAPELPANGVDGAGGPGARYLLGRLGERREAARKLESVRTRLAPLAIAERSSLLPRPGTPATAAFLVEKSDLERFRREAQELARELQDVALLCTGPWPPYNFTELLKEMG
jgi:Gas vesicle synthesis protein GvpL/GvpF